MPVPDGPTPNPVTDAVATLERWQRSGAVWRVLGRARTGAGSEVVIGLFSCDGGEEMGRFTSSDPALLALVDGRPDGEQWRRGSKGHDG